MEAKEPSVKLKPQDLDAPGDDFENAGRGFIDFLLLEAKAEDKNPLVGKEQARKYARSQNCRYVILSNGNLHCFWDLERGNPYIITTFPSSSITKAQASRVYANEADLVNVALFGRTAKQWRDANPGAEGNIRDHAPLEQLVVLTSPC